MTDTIHWMRGLSRQSPVRGGLGARRPDMLGEMVRSAVWLALLLPSCVGPKSKECIRQVGVASEASRNVDSKSIDSVRQGLDAVETAHRACVEAGRDDEAAQLDKGRKDLRAHLERLEKKAADPSQRPISEAELAELVKKGDSGCPQGQGYKHSGKEVRCTGPQIVDMSYPVARSYFERRGYKVTDVPPSSLRAEHGAELFVLEYEGAQDDRPPRCLRIQPPPEQSWQEAVARASGVRPDKITAGGKLSVKRGSLGVSVEADAGSAVRLGDCAR